MGHTDNRCVEVVEALVLDQGHDLGADAGKGPPFLQVDHPVRAGHCLQDRVDVQGPDRAQVEDIGFDPVPGQRRGSLERHMHHLAVGDDAHVIPGALQLGHPQGDHVFAVRDLAPDVVQQLALHHGDGVVVPDRGGEETLGVGGGGGRHQLHPGSVHVVGLARLGVLGRELQRRPRGAAEDDGHRNLPVGHVQHLGRAVDDLVEGEEREVEGHELADRAQPGHRRAHAKPREAQLADRRIDDPPVPVPFQHPARDLVGAVVLGDLLAHEKDGVVPVHLLAHGGVQGIPVGQLSHGRHLRNRRKTVHPRLPPGPVRPGKAARVG